MKILFITSTRLGDGILSTGAVRHMAALYPQAEITVACGPLVEDIFKMAPNVVEVIALKKKKFNGHWVALAKQTMGTNWDIIIDLRNSLVSRLLRANKKYIWGKQDKNRHKVEQVAAVIQAENVPAPTLWFDTKTVAEAEKLVSMGKTPVIGVGPAANWDAKTWPAENFIDLLQRLTAADGILPDARIAVFAAPGEEEAAYKVLNSFPEDRQLNIIAKAKPAVAAAAIKLCDFYVGNDSGLMHAAAAVGIPTLGLFGPTLSHLYSPWGQYAAFVTTPESAETLNAPYKNQDPKTVPCLMETLTTDVVHTAAVALWEETQVRKQAEEAKTVNG